MQRPNEWLSLLANFAVIIGIGLLIYEIRQNEQVLKDGTRLSLLSLLHERDAWLIEPDFASIVVKAEQTEESLNPLELRRYTEWMSGKWNACEYIYERYSHEFTTDSYWIGWSNGCKALLGNSNARKAWAERREWYGVEFRAFFDDHAATFDNN